MAVHHLKATDDADGAGQSRFTCLEADAARRAIGEYFPPARQHLSPAKNRMRAGMQASDIGLTRPDIRHQIEIEASKGTIEGFIGKADKLEIRHGRRWVRHTIDDRLTLIDPAAPVS